MKKFKNSLNVSGACDMINNIELSQGHNGSMVVSELLGEDSRENIDQLELSDEDVLNVSLSFVSGQEWLHNDEENWEVEQGYNERNREERLWSEGGYPIRGGKYPSASFN